MWGLSMSTIGDRIKRVRKLNELNQVDFASRIGVSQGTLSELEQDKYKPSTETVMAIRDQFKTNLHWLLYGTIESDNERTSYDIQIDAREISIIENLRKLKWEDQEDIIDFIKIKVKKRNIFT
jgi:transcriptional regulator with XRE-family HTH domain